MSNVFKPACRYCTWWHYDKEKLIAQCRLRGPVCGGTSEHTYTAWPLTAPDDFCGEISDMRYNTNVNMEKLREREQLP